MSLSLHRPRPRPRAALLTLVVVLPSWAQAAPVCECRLPGGLRATLGERACLRSTDGGWRVALCVMELNNTSWRFTDERCAPAARRPTS